MSLAVSMARIAPGDREDFLRLAEQHFRELNPAFVPQEDWKRCYFESLQSTPHFFPRWIVVNGERAGFILFGLEKHRFLPRQTGVVYELYVAPAHRRKGVASTCARQAIAELWTFAPSKIQLEVVEGNTGAAELWKSLGFNKITERYVLTGGGK